MSVVLAIIFTSLWAVLGACILIGIALEGIASMIKAFKGNN